MKLKGYIEIALKLYKKAEKFRFISPRYVVAILFSDNAKCVFARQYIHQNYTDGNEGNN